MAERPSEDDTIDPIELSRAISHALRHEPWRYELELDDAGWTDLEALLSALRRRGDAWETLDRRHVERMIETSGKKRHEIDGDRIRALYGHSVPGRLQRQPATPPDVLFHGTSPTGAAHIEVDGLLPMGRQYVHLSADRETAMAVGERKHPEPVLLRVDARSAHHDGVRFYAGNDRVWLADEVPARYLRAEGDAPTG